MKTIQPISQQGEPGGNAPRRGHLVPKRLGRIRWIAGGQSNGRSRGFSIIEMIVVVAILGIILAMAIPNFSSGNQRRRTEAAAQDLSTRIQMARHRTIASRIPHRLVLEPTNKTYHTERRQADFSWVRSPDEIYSLPPGTDWEIEAGGSPTNTIVEFESRGTVLEEDAPLRVLLTNALGDTFSLSLVRTGRITVR